MLFLFLFISSLSFAEIRFKDDVDREIVLEKPLTRVVVASRYNNELIRAIGNIKKVKKKLMLCIGLYKHLKELGCIINGVDRRNFYQCIFLIKKVETIKFSC